MAEYDSNVFGDYWGGGSLNATAYLDIGIDAQLGMGGLALGADYNGDFSTYLQYQDMSQSDHDLRLLLWRGVGDDGFLSLGGGMEYGINGQGRSYYDSRYPYGYVEAKVYPWPSFLTKLSAQMGRQSYPHLPKYDADRISGELSASLFLPTRTSLSIGGSARHYSYRPGGDSLSVPEAITHLEPGLRLTQNLTSGLGLSVEYFGLINRVSTISKAYHPDTLLVQVSDYSDYRGGAAGARITARIGAATAAARAGYRFLNYTELEAFARPAADTSSLASRLPTGELRRDRIATLGLDIRHPLSPSVGARAGLEFIDNSSNDGLFDYYRTIMSLGLEYDF